jgi:peptidoglycan/LPS O-acetylase OafA/YrhL
VAEYLGFLIRRAFRIFPLFLFVLLASHLVAITIYPLSAGDHLTAHFHEYWVRRKGWPDIAREALLVIRIPANSVERYMPQDWTLTVELIVSSMIPFLTLLMKRRKWLGILAVPVLAKVPGLTTWVLEFGIGVILFHTMEQTGEYWRRMGIVARAGVVLLSLSLMSCFFHFGGYLSNSHLLFGLTADRLIVAAGCALAIPVILHSSTVQRILSAPLLERLGESCYGLYLFHFLLLIAFGDYALGGLLALGVAMPVAKLLLLAGLLVVTAALSIGFHYILEMPLNRWGKRLGRAVAGVNITNRISLLK